MAQHYKNEEITISRLKTFLGWENFNTKGNVAPGRMDQNLCGRLWDEMDSAAVQLSKCEKIPAQPLSSPGVLSGLEFRSAKVGEKFGPTWSEHLFRLQIEIPRTMDGKTVHLIWNSNSEALVMNEKGHPRQGLVGGDGMCRRVDYLLSDNPVSEGEQFTLYIKIACNGLFGAGRGGDIEPPDPDCFYELAEVGIAAFNKRAWNLISDLTVLVGLAQDLPKESPRRAAALHVANAVVNAVEVDDASTYAAGLEISKKFLNGARNGHGQTKIYTQLHSHIDLAWLWPMKSTPGKACRTFSSTLRLLEEYPEAVYVQSQAQLYAWVKEMFPTLYEEVKESVREGRFRPVGGTWVEMDCNVPCGESLVRQFMEGQSFFQTEFGKHCEEFWLPDTFGYPAQLPQIMRQSGIEYFLSIKLSWNTFNKFPHSTFNWEGLDGSDVIVHFPPANTYNSTGSVSEVVMSGRKNKDIGVVNASIQLVGHGDGGGGASPAMLESLSRMGDVDGLPKVKFTPPVDFFEFAKKKKSELPRWTMSELYFELHRGTYTSQAGIKKGNFDCERMLLLSEMLSTVSILDQWCSVRGANLSDFHYPENELRRLWRIVLLNQFHDTLPGTCIAEVYREAAVGHREVMKACEKIVGETLKNIGESYAACEPSLKRLRAVNGSSVTDTGAHDEEKRLGLVCVNAGALGRQVKTPYVLEVSQELLASVSDQVSTQIPSIHPIYTSDHISDSSSEKVYIALKRRSQGLGVSLPSLENDAGVTRIFRNSDGFVMENSVVRVWISRTGHVESFVLLDTWSQRDREVISKNSQGGGNQLWLYDDVPMFWDAWDVEVYNFEKRWPVPDAVSCRIGDSGGLRASIHFEYGRTRAGTKITQTISLSAGSPQLDFRTRVDWQERRKLLRVEFPTTVRATHAYYGTQFGHVARPTTFNTSWDVAKFEVCAHGYADLSEYQFGVALLTDGTKYGASARNNMLRLSLLKSSRSPDDKADIGIHEFTYALLPHEKSFPCTEVLAAAADLASPPILTALPKNAKSFEVNVYGLDSVAVSSVKFANRKSDVIVIRAYEALGGRGDCRIVLSVPIERVRRVALCDFLEHEVDDEKSTVRLLHRSDLCEVAVQFSPFQIRSVMIFLRRVSNS